MLRRLRLRRKEKGSIMSRLEFLRRRKNTKRRRKMGKTSFRKLRTKFMERLKTSTRRSTSLTE